MRLLLVLLLLFPSVAMASENCCFVGPGECFVISSASEKQTCQDTPSTIALHATCKESPECLLSEEPVAQPPENKGAPLQKNAIFTNASERSRSVR